MSVNEYTSGIHPPFHTLFIRRNIVAPKYMWPTLDKLGIEYIKNEDMPNE